MTLAHPATVAGITPEYLNALMEQAATPGRVAEVEIVDAKTYGEQMVSTAGRVLLNLRYAPGSAELPSRVVLKLPRGVDEIMSPFYANETAFYRMLRPSLDIEAPLCLGADFSPDTNRFGILLEDLTARQATFPNVTQPIRPDTIKPLLDTLAKLHATFWNASRFSKDLAWVETHLAGGVANLMNNLAPAYIQREIDTENFKRELVQKLRTTGLQLLAGVQAVQRHQSTLPQTLLHGDTHLGNTYLLPDGAGGLLDWQLMVRGHAMHDVNYLITTALNIADRRAQERDLLNYYLDRLATHHGKPVLSFNDAWLEYRRALVWGVYIGWLTTPVVNYGWEINVLNHLRLITAYEDHETARLVGELS